MKLDNSVILVTGANGFIGRHLCKRLNILGNTVIGLGRTKVVENSFVQKQYISDMSDAENIDKIVMEVSPDIVIHLAGQKFDNLNGGYIISYKNNLISSLNLILSCKKIKNLKSFISVGSCEEYGQQSVPFNEQERELPNSAYGCSKLSVTQLLQSLSRSFGFPSLIIRPSVIYGPGQSSRMFIPSLISTLLKGHKFDMTLGEQTRDFVFVDDLVESIILSCGVRFLDASIVNISSGEGVYIKDLAKMIANLIGSQSIDLINFGAKAYAEGEIMDYFASNLVAYDLLNWKPKLSLEVGIKRTLLHYEKLNNLGAGSHI
jgi:UDP-glucose 4-epimerase